MEIHITCSIVTDTHHVQDSVTVYHVQSLGRILITPAKFYKILFDSVGFAKSMKKHRATLRST